MVRRAAATVAIVVVAVMGSVIVAVAERLGRRAAPPAVAFAAADRRYHPSDGRQGRQHPKRLVHGVSPACATGEAGRRLDRSNLGWQRGGSP
jgi:hypothetical protein